MGVKTGIAWTGSTWNPWRGCTRVSPGCAKCYMFTEQTRYGLDPNIVTRTKPGTFNAPLKWAQNKSTKFVFTCSWSDFFHADADKWRDEAWDIIRRTPELTYQVLTKRPERVAEHLPADWGEGYPNVWLGTTIESAKYIYRLKELAQVEAKVHFVSAEPLLGSLKGPNMIDLTYADWIIVGGESGVGARPMNLDWAREIRDFCQMYDVKFFLKQLGGYPKPRSHDEAILDGKTYTEMPE